MLSICPKLNLDQIELFLRGLVPLTESLLLDVAEILINLSDKKAREIGKALLTSPSTRGKRRRVTNRRGEIEEHLRGFLRDVRGAVRDSGEGADGAPAKVPGSGEGEGAARGGTHGAGRKQARQQTGPHQGATRKRGRRAQRRRSTSSRRG